MDDENYKQAVTEEAELHRLKSQMGDKITLNPNRDRFGYGTPAPDDESQPSRERIADYFLRKYDFNNRELTDFLKKWLSTPYQDEKDIGDARLILKRIFPESGLLKMSNKKTGKEQMTGTWSGQSDEESIKRFESYRLMSKELFLAKGIPSELWSGELE